MFASSRLLFTACLVGGSFCSVLAQDAIRYQEPPQVLKELSMAKPSPSVSADGKGNWMVVMERSDAPAVDILAQPELRVAGLRINPNNFGPSRANYITGMYLQRMGSNKPTPIAGLPANLRAGNVSWNPSETRIAFTHARDQQIDLYIIDVAKSSARRINARGLNMVMGNDPIWVNDEQLLYSSIVAPASKAPQRNPVPSGPIVQENLGKAAASATFQDLIKSPFDEDVFAFYATAQLVWFNGTREMPVGKPDLYSSIELSPNRQFLLQRVVHKPFSYLVPAGGFNSIVRITNLQGRQVRELAKLPSSELAPRGFDNTLNAPRGFNWVASSPARVTWMMPLDSGLIKKQVPFHDAIYLLDAPFAGEPKLLTQTVERAGNLVGVNDTMYLVIENSRAKHRQKWSRFNPITGATHVLIDRSTDDAYGDPGTPLSVKNKAGQSMIRFTADHKIMMRGTGASAQGDFPFLASFDIHSKKLDTLWRCRSPYYESVVTMMDNDDKRFVTVRQSRDEAPNYFLRTIGSDVVQPLTQFADPQPALRNLVKTKITYKRKDGLDLAADLYVPKGYDPARDGRLPVFMWAYPREYKRASDAAQVRGSQYTFTRINWGSSIYWATQGYAVMDATEFPIVGEGDQQPNDNFVEQLTWNAEAAIDKIVDMGIGDRNRVGVGGHSYGAFMTANLLAHTKLFKAGIARSGAYNRTLTPFGFQNEERTFWQAPDVYSRMSPFNYADKIKTPILLIHGEADNNSGTFPIQSERLYNAVKGHGGTIRYVQLPYESHGYAARENILHMLWEMTTWLDKYVKNAK